MKVRIKNKDNSKISLITLLIVSCVALSIGYSALSTTLKINGVANVDGMSFKIEFQNLSEASLTGNAVKITDPVISENKTELKSYNVNFLEPGDSISYTFQIANNGTINAKLSEIVKDTISCEGYGNGEQATKDATNVCANLEYSLKYANEEEHYDDNGSPQNFSSYPEVNDVLNAGDVKDMILTLKYKSPVDGVTIEEPQDDVSISSLGINLTYSQVKTPTIASSKPDTPVISTSFAEDSWKTIANNVKTGNTSNYHVGDTKIISVKNYGLHTVRISNMSTPDECKQEGFSQTACGFVVEFADIITNAKLNNSYTNIGGWASSSISKTLNDESNSSSFINSLPSDLRSLITTTTVVSGHGSTSGESNSTTTNKLYLLSTKEVWENGTTSNAIDSNSDTGRDATRQLDYYKEKGVSTTTFGEAIKKLDDTASMWWLRSAMGTNDVRYFSVSAEGDWNGPISTFESGISPAFRLEGPVEKPTNPVSFADDSWDTIAKAVKAGKTEKYKVGDTKEVDLGTYGKHKVRIANMNTPNECKQEGFSQSACGFVVEFTDIITTHNMNPKGEYKGKTYDYGWNKDGWPASQMKTFIDNDIYNSLPDDLKKVIIDTKTISGHGKLDSENHMSTDKLYLLATAEVWKDGDRADAARDKTRQLDYYNSKGVTTSSYATAIKKDSTGTAAKWWLRCASSGGDNCFCFVNDSGRMGIYVANGTNGVSPAFRLEGPVEESTNPVSFAEDSWSTIAKAVKSGKTENYKVGDEKEVDLGAYGKHMVRIANMSTPNECKQNGFSQSACGFVVEFTDIVTMHNMNPSGDYNGKTYSNGWNKDGWPKSQMKTFLDSDIYNSLPNDLKDVIITTETVSGHGSEDTNNFTSTDKLYLLSTAEIWAQGTSNTIDYDSARDKTRQLDYYKSKGVTTGDYADAIKNNSSGAATSWWLRSANSNTNTGFYAVAINGNWSGSITTVARNTYGVSPAFRIPGDVTENNDGPSESSSFANDSWATIANAVKTGNTDKYNVGDTKKITLNGAEEYNVRIVNMSTPSECKQNGFSQTACGFVVEFADIITNAGINTENTVVGGWQGSYINAYMNIEIPEALPKDVASVVTDTNIISYDDRNIGSLYTSTNKYYIPSALEYLSTDRYTEDVLNQFNDYGKTRQLDYYKMLSDAGTLDEALKRSFEGNVDAPYWTRSVVNNTNFHYFGTATSGVDATSELGFVILFRLEGPDDYKETPSSFANDSWKTIAEAVKTGNTSNYHIGDTKIITIPEVGTQMLRIVNKSTPSECKQNGFSQTACGFVIERSNILQNVSMNLENTVEGAWPESILRYKLNEDFSDFLAYNLASIATDTNVISYKDRSTGSLYTSTDKYYLPSALEYYPTDRYTEDVLNQFDDYGKTRQLDYYKALSDAGTLDEVLKRSFNGNTDTPYWTRSVVNNTSFHYFGTAASGVDATSELGLVSLFRLEGPDDYKETLPSFKNESWTTIAENVKKGNIDHYHIGDTKEVDLGAFGIHTVRISNMSTPNECNGDGFSQSACGFVIEFTDIITTHNMNPTSVNKGGWPASNMYKFLNDEGDVNSLINALPIELKNVITTTKTISGYGKEDTSNFTSIDKLYLLAPKEIYKDWSNQNDTAKDKNRQLDYYKKVGTTINNYDSAYKLKDSSSYHWWLRNADSNTNNKFYYINSVGSAASVSANSKWGVSPAFRIG